jgi:nicotinate-nucleotide adenylyltransferase
MGSDSLEDLPTWREPERILELAGIGAVERSGYPLRRALEEIPSWLRDRIEEGTPPPGALEAGKVYLSEEQPLEVSSTEIRRRLRHGEPMQGLLDVGVARYIERTGLYRR